MCHVNRDSLTHCSQGSVAQLVEQRTSNPKVVGSNPTWATEFFNNSVGHFSVGYHHWCCPEDGSNVDQQTGRVLVVGLDLQVTRAVPSTLVLFILAAV